MRRAVHRCRRSACRRRYRACRTRGPPCDNSWQPVNVWLQSRSLPARGRVGLEVHRCLCIIDAGSVFISTVMQPESLS